MAQIMFVKSGQFNTYVGLGIFVALLLISASRFVFVYETVQNVPYLHIGTPLLFSYHDTLFSNFHKYERFSHVGPSLVLCTRLSLLLIFLPLQKA
jgi:hypothetical protein